MAKRVYFAFHYQDVKELRANVVRKHNFTGGVERAGYYDHSIWEEAKTTSPVALKRLINGELEGTSVTAVLIGSETWARPWVRYEIFKSIQRGNRVLGIHINSIAGQDQRTKTLGPDPFNNLAIEFSSDGNRASPVEWNGRAWKDFSELNPWETREQPVERRGQSFRLNAWHRVYDWVADDGFHNFGSWIE